MDDATICRHCRLPSGTSGTSGIPGFCCAGCRTAFEVINACGLQAFYRLRREEPGRKVDVAVVDAGAWLDGEAFSARNVHQMPDGRSR